MGARGGMGNLFLAESVFPRSSPQKKLFFCGLFAYGNAVTIQILTASQKAASWLLDRKAGASCSDTSRMEIFTTALLNLSVLEYCRLLTIAGVANSLFTAIFYLLFHGSAWRTASNVKEWKRDVAALESLKKNPTATEWLRRQRPPATPGLTEKERKGRINVPSVSVSDRVHLEDDSPSPYSSAPSTPSTAHQQLARPGGPTLSPALTPKYQGSVGPEQDAAFAVENALAYFSSLIESLGIIDPDILHEGMMQKLSAILCTLLMRKIVADPNFKLPHSILQGDSVSILNKVLAFIGYDGREAAFRWDGSALHGLPVKVENTAPEVTSNDAADVIDALGNILVVGQACFSKCGGKFGL